MLLCFLAVSLDYISAQNDIDEKAIARFLACDIEEISDEEFERLSEYLLKQMKVNLMSHSELVASGLFTRFQAASVSDYKKRYGQILSLMELASLDGFNEDIAESIAPFISFEYIPDYAGRVAHEVTTRLSTRISEENVRLGYASRYKMSYGDAMNISLAVSRSLSSAEIKPDALCGSIESRFKRIPMRIVLGDFNARFAQGLAIWSGVNFSSLNSPSAFLKRASGFTPSASFTGTGTLKGAAVEYVNSNISLSAGVAPSAGTIFNYTRLWRHGQVGITHNKSTSIDVSACIEGVDLFTEVAYSWSDANIAYVLGTIFPVGDYWDFAAMLRGTTDEYDFSMSGSFQKMKCVNGTFSADLALYETPKVDTQDRSLQLKLHSQWTLTLTETLNLIIRGTERLRSWGVKNRTDIRTDLVWNYRSLYASCRLNVLTCRNSSFLSYAEGGIKTEKSSLYLRQGAFIVDHWDDRIYAYERDAPGCFNSPAFYGRGVWTSFMASFQFSRWCKLYLRAGYTSYLFMKENKPGKAELRFQSVFDF